MRSTANAVIFAILGVAVGAGIMAWEPWADDGDEQAAQEASGERTLYGKVWTKDWRPGFVSLFDAPEPQVGSSCTGLIDGNGFGCGTQLVVSDGSGNFLARDKLGDGTIGGIELDADDTRYYNCVFDIRVPDVPTADFYSIKVGRWRGPTYSHDELEAMDWTVAFELEN